VSRPKFTPLNILIAVVGAILLIYTVRRVGWADVVAGITSVGWWFAAVVLLGASRMAVRARAWMVCANSGLGLRAPFDSTGFASKASLAQGRPGCEELGFRQAFGAILAADAAGNLTPLGLLASEPTKILMTRGRITTVTSVASVAIENAFYIASVAVVLLTGTWFFFQRADVPPNLQLVAQLIVAVVAIIGLAGVWLARSQPAILSKLAPLITRLAGKSAVPADAVREIEARIYGVLQWPISRIGRALIWEAAFHVAAVAEVWLVLRLLPGGERTTLLDAFLMESAGRFVMIAFKFVPYRLGIDEAGSGAVAQVLGLNPATGVTLALVRRLRIILLNVFGLIRLARQ
jgi:hypothetical protein